MRRITLLRTHKTAQICGNTLRSKYVLCLISIQSYIIVIGICLIYAMDVNLYVTRVIANGRQSTEIAAMRGLAIHSVVIGGYNSSYLYHYGDFIWRNNQTGKITPPQFYLVQVQLYYILYRLSISYLTNFLRGVFRNSNLRVKVILMAILFPGRVYTIQVAQLYYTGIILRAIMGMERLDAIFTHGCTGYYTYGAEIKKATY